ncbi:MAG: ornithine carbamoyltransferase [Alphaproteobacteria bacterium]
MPNFLDLDLLDTPVLRHILDSGREMKRAQRLGHAERPLAGKMLAMLFERPSTRTRVSFEVGMRQLGGEVIVLDSHGTQLGRGETIADTARVLSRYVDAIVFRTTDHTKLRELAEHASVPVINGLSNLTHPCQLMADVMTYEEHRGPIAGKQVAWSGDVNNMAVTWMQAAARFGFGLRVAYPREFTPPDTVLRWARDNGAAIELCHDVALAARGADCVVTDAWVSMGQDDVEHRHRVLEPFRVDGRVMKLANPDAVFMHCLPAHRGEEVSEDVIDGPQSLVWDEAENRLHAQKAILSWCLA